MDLNAFMNDMSEGFDEAQYLEANPDVAKALGGSVVKSGFQHYMLFGYHEGRPGVSGEFRAKLENVFSSGVLDKVVSPPPHLRKRVHGSEAMLGFEHLGTLIADDLHDAIRQHYTAPRPSRRQILDFGCGCGRVVKYLHGLLQDDSQFYGVDIDPESIQWCRQNLSSIGEFSVNNHLPPFDFEAGKFDMVYSISVFTHLPEDMQYAWLEELHRVTCKGGTLFLTVHGEHIFPVGDEHPERQKLKAEGFGYYLGKGTEGLPDFYQTAWHTEEYIHKNWTKYFEIIEIRQRGIASNQDLVICRRH